MGEELLFITNLRIGELRIKRNWRRNDRSFSNSKGNSVACDIQFLKILFVVYNSIILKFVTEKHEKDIPSLATYNSWKFFFVAFLNSKIRDRKTWERCGIPLKLPPFGQWVCDKSRDRKREKGVGIHQVSPYDQSLLKVDSLPMFRICSALLSLCLFSFPFLTYESGVYYITLKW